jgi:hypothetical protein
MGGTKKGGKMVFFLVGQQKRQDFFGLSRSRFNKKKVGKWSFVGGTTKTRCSTSTPGIIRACFFFFVEIPEGGGHACFFIPTHNMNEFCAILG